MPETELALTRHREAVELHQKILTSATLAQQNLWDMCSGLKKMRDGKLYKEFGYQNFEDYCEKEVGLKRSNAYNYIAVVEKLNLKNVQSIGQIGITKLALLATLSEEHQAEIAEKVDLEETTVRQLKAEIDQLKVKNKELEEDRAKAEKRASSAEISAKRTSDAYHRLEGVNEQHYKNFAAEREKVRNLQEEKTQLEKENEELRNRPVDVAVVDNSDENDRKLNEVIRSLERENMKRNEELDRQYIEDRRKLEEDKRREIAALRKEYEKKFSSLPKAEPVDEDTLRMNAYIMTMQEDFDKIIEFTKVCGNADFNYRIGNLIDNFTEKWEELNNEIL